ncbi:DUF1684 domain-containing protein [Flavobacterium sp. JP2137]|uniref:DUF1684 domain-containing protein n=1 Tax=Flavobacterium sp. JP2137 TaxID=3414510 RepID=UPI003D2FEA6E
MNRIVLLLSLLFLTAACAQNATPTSEAMAFQKRLNEEFKDGKTSPLPKDAIKKFTALAFFPIDERYVVQARLIPTPDSEPFEMPTTTARKPMYKKYGELHFDFEGVPVVLSVFQNLELLDKADHKNSLFLPFTDLTSGVSSYGGGRYMDLQIPSGDSLTLNFNLAYNPYCVYNHKYSCPIPPEENYIKAEIKAGVMDYKYE